jgi:hypothetical protein
LTYTTAKAISAILTNVFANVLFRNGGGLGAIAAPYKIKKIPNAVCIVSLLTNDPAILLVDSNTLLN